MGKTIKFTSLDRVISKIYRDLGLEEISETDLIEWSAEALEFFSTINNYENAVAYLEVKNHQVEIPTGLVAIRQLVRDNKPIEKDLCENSKNEFEDFEELEIIKCKDCIEELDYDFLALRNYNDLEKKNPVIVKYHTSFTQRFTPIRLSNHTFFNSVVCPENHDIYKSCEDEYTIVQNKIRTSFKEGFVLLSYYRIFLDEETGYPLIPDNIETITAIQYYITWKYMQRMWYMGREGYSDKMQYSEERWLKYCSQARNKQIMTNSLDEQQNLLEGKFSWLKDFKYYNFFGNIGRANFKIK